MAHVAHIAVFLHRNQPAVRRKSRICQCSLIAFRVLFRRYGILRYKEIHAKASLRRVFHRDGKEIHGDRRVGEGPLRKLQRQKQNSQQKQPSTSPGHIPTSPLAVFFIDSMFIVPFRTSKTTSHGRIRTKACPSGNFRKRTEKPPEKACPTGTFSGDILPDYLLKPLVDDSLRLLLASRQESQLHHIDNRGKADL